MILTDYEAKQAYDRTLGEPEEKKSDWEVEVTITKTYTGSCNGTRAQAEASMKAWAIEQDGNYNPDEDYIEIESYEFGG